MGYFHRNQRCLITRNIREVSIYFTLESIRAEDQEIHLLQGKVSEEFGVFSITLEYLERLSYRRDERFEEGEALYAITQADQCSALVHPAPETYLRLVLKFGMHEYQVFSSNFEVNLDQLVRKLTFAPYFEFATQGID